MTHLFSILPAHPEYLDPGSGSMIIQMVIATVLGLGVVIRVFWKNIKAFFTGKKVNEDSVEDPTAIPDDDLPTIGDDVITDTVVNDPTASQSDKE